MVREEHTGAAGAAGGVAGQGARTRSTTRADGCLLGVSADGAAPGPPVCDRGAKARGRAPGGGAGGLSAGDR
jgi:hypothetical protein